MELRHLRYFVVTAAHGSFNRAAHILRLTQPALSRQVKALEDELGVELLKRGRNSLELTPAGERFYEEAREVLARAELAVKRVRVEKHGDVLRVGYSPSATAGILPGALQRFQEENPGVRVELADESPPELIRLAVEGRLDVVVALEPSVTSTPGFYWTEFRRVNQVLVMRSDHPLAKFKRVAPERLRELPLVGLARENFADYVPYVRRILKPFGIEPNFVAMETDGVSTLFASVEAYHAAAILAEGVAGFMPRSLVSRPFHPRFDPIVAWLGLSSTHPNPHAERFAKLLRREVGRARANAT